MTPNIEKERKAEEQRERQREHEKIDKTEAQRQSMTSISKEPRSRDKSLPQNEESMVKEAKRKKTLPIDIRDEVQEMLKEAINKNHLPWSKIPGPNPKEHSTTVQEDFHLMSPYYNI
ncbi:hypothetical protein R1flu_023209 [Riccia fluitans]|uniref:Uncharacterized protein n=1 Tax=Riccia fluitans TaxID=41844 RepID=A0ABD1XRJ6_9MARC